MEKPPTRSTPGRNRSTHWPASKERGEEGRSTTSRTVGERVQVEATTAHTASGARNWPAVRSRCEVEVGVEGVEDMGEVEERRGWRRRSSWRHASTICGQICGGRISVTVT